MIESRFSRFAQLCPEEVRGTRLVSIAIEKDVSKEKCGRGLGRARASNAIPPLALYTFSTAPIFQPRLPFSRLSIRTSNSPSNRTLGKITRWDGEGKENPFLFYQRIRVSIFHSLKTSIDLSNRFNYPLSMPREKNFEFQRRTSFSRFKSEQINGRFRFRLELDFRLCTKFHSLRASSTDIYIYIYLL